MMQMTGTAQRRQNQRSLRGAFYLWIVAASGCSAPSSPSIHLDTTNSKSAVVEVRGLSSRDLARIANANLTTDEWSTALRVSVVRNEQRGSGEPAVAGRYVVDGVLRFEPMFPFDPGREYQVVFDPGAVRGRGLPELPRLSASVGLPASARVASTSVVDVFPSGDVVPENLLRMYIQFSAPMGLQSTLDHLSLVDAEGRDLGGALLPLDTELWSPDRTRATVLFDPGRVKRGIMPNREAGRPLRSGGRFTLIVKSSWTDGQGLPLTSEFRKTYRVGVPKERALSTADWRVTPPAPGSRDPLVVTFPQALDRGLLQRALGVTGNGQPVSGDVRIEDHETRWLFTPGGTWSAGDYSLVVQPVLEDPSGNRIGRAFEVISTDENAAERSEPFVVPFRVR
jgi:hypothetical protein